MADLKQNLNFEQQAEQAAQFLKTLGNPVRLQILCLLADEKELSVGELVALLPLTQSALSQHLAKLRDEGLVAYRRESQTLYYFVCSENALKLLLILKEMFCS
ncbi:metalloregulator ArsR/SmtB family transcription factor [Kingella kingae]|uniref:ArsR/SmtB family transcription factor n=1 Tax=Kingella kingae TaxID=504 RepID=UPI0003F981C3|nr:metalloregulator ArsR/SmtB family transcription factor [Kingella kingae]MDK4544700.1 metalloregulator ArsR/SmtB family transcription factor [Kingella kingae]MDK4566731.1 metalloregulator ArsR/SmtB family transcription factor [Kingella kingae]MDK4589719.1 metalloregulator ArsR/SmtB family transcription factor [Kingella kingae]MDK4628473.1 metalloregulator ArsR/SmtB family transcription factor [Kingella kingae]MDK4636349.1 metalloregulator ArsR/SmtB family transcription factor [Kingella kinga